MLVVDAKEVHLVVVVVEFRFRNEVAEELRGNKLADQGPML
jgi:hypothetical protein